MKKILKIITSFFFIPWLLMSIELAKDLGNTIHSESIAHQNSLNEKPFVIVSASYNAKEWSEACLTSVFDQAKTYTNFRVICIDDASIDGTSEELERVIKKHNQQQRVIFIKNKVRVGILANIYAAITSCHDDEVIVTVDGDDKLLGTDVLKTLNEVYQDESVWMTYGQFVPSHPRYVGECSQIPDEIIKANTFRQYAWVSSHLKTFYAWLFKRINLEDLKLNGQFFPVATDLSYMFPMLEMAGTHSRFISKVIYEYTATNPLSEIWARKPLVDACANIIKSRSPYVPLSHAKAPRLIEKPR